MRIKKDNCLALLIDIQEKLFPHMHKYKELEVNCLRLMKGLNALNIPILVTQQYTKGLGDTISSLKGEYNGEFYEKIYFSACGSDDLLNKLKELNKKYLIVFGIESHICVLQTCLDLLEHQFQPVIVSDCISSRSKQNKKIALARMIQENVTVTSLESILFELCEKAGTPEFKTISSLVK